MPGKKRKYSDYSEQHQRLIAHRQLDDASSSDSENVLSEEEITDGEGSVAISEVESESSDSEISQRASECLPSNGNRNIESSPGPLILSNENMQTTQPSPLDQLSTEYPGPEDTSENDDSSEEEEDLMYFSDIEDDDNESDPFNPNLREFCLKHLNDTGMKELLNLLDSTGKFPDLPRNVNELLCAAETSTMVSPVKIKNGEYMHLGIRANLAMLNLHEVPKQLTITISWDGVRIFKSSRMQMWPIVMEVEETKDIFLIGVFLGHKKPKSNIEYFYCLIKELELISQNNDTVSVGVNRIQTKLAVSKFLADTPARLWAIGKNHEFSIPF